MYVGSLSVSCKGYGGTFSAFFGKFGKSSKIVVTDETVSAKKIAQASLIKYGQISTSLMQQYDKFVAPFTMDKHVPMGVMTRDTKLFSTPDLMWRRASADANVGDTNVIMSGIRQESGSILLVAGDTILRIKGFIEKGKYQPCMQELELEARKLDTAEILCQTLNKTLQKYGISQLVKLDGNGNIYENLAKNGFKSALLAKILRIELKEDKDWGKKFYVEVAIRVKLKKLLLIHVYMTESFFTRILIVLYMGVIIKPMSCRYMKLLSVEN